MKVMKSPNVVEKLSKFLPNTLGGPSLAAHVLLPLTCTLEQKKSKVWIKKTSHLVICLVYLESAVLLVEMGTLFFLLASTLHICLLTSLDLLDVLTIPCSVASFLWQVQHTLHQISFLFHPALSVAQRLWSFACSKICCRLA